MGSVEGDGRHDTILLAANRTFYEALWSRARLHQPREFNTWRLVMSLLARSSTRLELGPGLRPRLPIAGTCLVDVSRIAGRRLRAHGGLAITGDVVSLSTCGLQLPGTPSRSSVGVFHDVGRPRPEIRNAALRTAMSQRLP